LAGVVLLLVLTTLLRNDFEGVRVLTIVVGDANHRRKLGKTIKKASYLKSCAAFGAGSYASACTYLRLNRAWALVDCLGGPLTKSKG
jgi:hypothetical protein